MAKQPASDNLFADIEDTGGSVDVTTVIEYDVDMDSVPEPLTLPKGVYVGEVMQVEVKESKGKTLPNGDPSRYLATTFRVTPDQFPIGFDASGHPAEGIDIVFRRVSADNTPRGIVSMQSFRALFGLARQNPTTRTYVSVGDKPGKTYDTKELIGKRARIVVGHNTYNERTSPEITKVLKLAE